MALFEKSSQPPTNYRLLLSTRRYLFGAIGMSVLSMIIFFMIIFPRIQGAQVHRQELQLQQQRLKDSTEKLTLLQNVDQTALFQERARIEALLPASKPLLPLIARMEKLSIDTNIIVTSFEVSPGELSTESAELKKQSTKAQETTSDTVLNLPLNLTIYGSIENIYQFLEGIDTLIPIADITGVSLATTQVSEIQSESSGVNPVYEAKLSLQAYYYLAKPKSSSQQPLPNVQLRPDLLEKLQTFVIPEAQPSDALPPEILNGGKLDLFE